MDPSNTNPFSAAAASIWSQLVLDWNKYEPTSPLCENSGGESPIIKTQKQDVAMLFKYAIQIHWWLFTATSVPLFLHFYYVLCNFWFQHLPQLRFTPFFNTISINLVTSGLYLFQLPLLMLYLIHWAWVWQQNAHVLIASFVGTHWIIWIWMNGLDGHF